MINDFYSTFISHSHTTQATSLFEAFARGYFHYNEHIYCSRIDLLFILMPSVSKKPTPWKLLFFVSFSLTLVVI
jgi:hypothetical protein